VSNAFNFPNSNGDAPVTVNNRDWMAVGQYVFVQTAGFMTVTSFTGSGSGVVNLRNVAYSENIAPGVLVSAGVRVVATGPKGLQGLTGAAGAAGAAAQGLPVGGDATQILAKIDGNNYNTEWINKNQLDNYLVGDLPNAADFERTMIYVPDGDGGNPCVAISDGADWYKIVLGASIP
jgi:hypothetical protein